MGRDLFGIKFANHLAAHITPEWHSQYIKYEDIVTILYAAYDRTPQPTETTSTIRKRYFDRIDERFFQYCEKELNKINIFFAEKLSEAIRRFDDLKTELSYFSNEIQEKRSSPSRHGWFNPQIIFGKHLPVNNLQHSSRYRRVHDLKLAFSELYLLLVLLQNYQTLNYMGFRKILKKHDKLFYEQNGANWFQENVEQASFSTNTRVATLIDEVEKLVTEQLEDGNRKQAMQKLRVPPLSQIHKRAVTYKLVGLNVRGWSMYGVNHVLIFELDPRNHMSHEEILEGGSILALIWCLSFLAFVLCEYYNIQPHLQPLTFILLLIIILCNPLPILFRPARYWLIRRMFRIFSAPFHTVTFADFWLADQFTSLDLIFYDIEYLICHSTFDTKWKSELQSYLNINSTQSQSSLSDEQITLFNAPICQASINILFQTIIGALPSWFRMAQCLRRYRDTRLIFPHLLNAIKYSAGLLVAFANGLQRYFSLKYLTQATNPFFYLWILTQIINSGFKYGWDIKMDWGFFDKQAGENVFLREELVYPKKFYYYAVIIENFIFRYIWILRVYLTVKHEYIENIELITFILGLIECIRRFLWNYFRLENEHLNNCGQFRAVRDISINPNKERQTLHRKTLPEESIGVGDNSTRNKENIVNTMSDKNIILRMRRSMRTTPILLEKSLSEKSQPIRLIHSKIHGRKHSIIIDDYLSSGRASTVQHSYKTISSHSLYTDSDGNKSLQLKC
ncbi:unnamed protein product [Didymodactylos carnosus]|uniref:Xenotropic and polytropic retrovirus receptor 1 n=1 Tax=Didymodactylos carnosus TaxID=1234261 RepID=A0A8S2HNU1_9BILA|nr:unnamed protein product [Didymodactylos carnosus]CAF3649990.1 unnamed protein product [Didymodactylos carnosus]